MINQIFNKWQVFSLSVLLIGGWWIWWSRPTEQSMMEGRATAPVEGYYAPNFELITTDGEMISLNSLNGRPVILNFWATWCPPCRKEMPDLEDVYTKYADQGLEILAVNVTTTDTITAVKNFIKEFKLSFPILLDTKGTVTDMYKVYSMPTTFFIDADGKIKEVVIGGPMSKALLITRIEKLLANEGD